MDTCYTTVLDVFKGNHCEARDFPGTLELEDFAMKAHSYKLTIDTMNRPERTDRDQSGSRSPARWDLAQVEEK